MPTLSEQHRDELVRALRVAVDELTKAEHAAGVWADDVSANVEQQLGVGPSDPQRFDDPIYARNLRLLSKIREARELVEGIQVP